MKPVKTINFNQKDYPDVIRIANELASFEHRTAHDAIKRLIIEEGAKRLQSYGSSFHYSVGGLGGEPTG